MKNKIAIIAIVLWVGTILSFGYFFVKGSTKESTDHRRAVLLSNSERDLVLGEMRALLKSLNWVFTGLAQNDQTFIVKAIEPVGMKMAADVNPVLMGKLPLEFKQLGMSVHKDFDVLREDISRGLSNQLITKRMSEITGKCIACHEAYRLSP